MKHVQLIDSIIEGHVIEQREAFIPQPPANLDEIDRENYTLQEWYRVVNKHLILIEPAYELANEEARKRMSVHGYVTNLFGTAKELGYNIIEHRLLEKNSSSNVLNPTGVIVIQKEAEKTISSPFAAQLLRRIFSKKEMLTTLKKFF